MDRLVRLAERATRDESALSEAAAAAFERCSTSRHAFPPPSAGEGTLRSRGGEGSAVSGIVAPLSRPSLTPRGLLGPPSPAEGGGEESALILEGPTLAALPEAVALRVVDLALDRAGGTLPRRLERLERLVLVDLLPALRARRPVRRTLRGLLIGADAAGRVTIRRAPPRRTDGLAAGAPDLLGKGKPSAYIDSACADEPAAAGSRPTRPRD